MQLILVLCLLAGWIYLLSPEAKANMAPFYPDDQRFKEPAEKSPDPKSGKAPERNTPEKKSDKDANEPVKKKEKNR